MSNRGYITIDFRLLAEWLRLPPGHRVWPVGQSDIWRPDHGFDVLIEGPLVPLADHTTVPRLTYSLSVEGEDVKVEIGLADDDADPPQFMGA